MLCRKLLIPTDFSDCSLASINWMSQLQSVGLEEIVLLHVINQEQAKILRSREAEIIEEELNKIASEMKSKGVKVQVSIKTGIPSIAITEAAKVEKVSMIVMGSNGKGIFKKMISGSTTFDVVRLSSIPILVIKLKKEAKGLDANQSCKDIKKVLLPVDFSECGNLLIERLKANHQLIKEVILLAVAEKGETQKEVNLFKDIYEKNLKDLAETLDQLGIVSEIRVEEGIASNKIIEVAEEEKVDMIAMGMTGECFIEALLLGSTAEAVLRRAMKPVLLIPCNR